MINQSQLEILKLLSTCKDQYRCAIISKSDKELVQALCECVYNILQGSVSLDSKNKEILHKYRHTLRKLCQKSPLKEKRKILVQKGGFLPYLLPIILSALPALFNK